MLHGFTGDGASFIENLSPLAENYRLIAPDLLGHGQTASPPDPKRYAISHAIADIKSLLTQLGIEKCVVLGYSMGGRLALGFSLSHPENVSALILESSSAGLSTPEEREARIFSDENLARRILAGGIENFVDEWEKLPLWDSQSANLKARLRMHRLKNNPLGLANSLRGMGTGAQPYLGNRLAELTMPVLLITGEHDTKFTRIAGEMAQSIPHVTIQTITGAGHAVHLEAPDDYIGVIRTFLQKLGL
ncbi:MAG: 2-succinyl-6-hydroxy-2,4-cyclohexadiene-1-carboxylate synthase [Anaerolineae bacterium]|nr:2-succinyl-6-hydroxy-2,4-cyclohexadiene-1-carboxylate synthase [Anaerolineae bacterium]